MPLSKCKLSGYQEGENGLYTVAEIQTVSQVEVSTAISALPGSGQVSGEEGSISSLWQATLVNCSLKYTAACSWSIEIQAAFMKDYKLYKSLQKLKIQLEVFCFQQTCNLHKIEKEMF